MQAADTCNENKPDFNPISDTITEMSKLNKQSRLSNRFHFYHPRRKASEGYVFTGICHSVTEQGRGCDTKCIMG